MVSDLTHRRVAASQLKVRTRIAALAPEHAKCHIFSLPSQSDFCRPHPWQTVLAAHCVLSEHCLQCGGEPRCPGWQEQATIVSLAWHTEKFPQGLGWQGSWADLSAMVDNVNVVLKAALVQFSAYAAGMTDYQGQVCWRRIPLAHLLALTSAFRT